MGTGAHKSLFYGPGAGGRRISENSGRRISLAMPIHFWWVVTVPFKEGEEMRSELIFAAVA
jgi:hypothetical protein